MSAQEFQTICPEIHFQLSNIKIKIFPLSFNLITLSKSFQQSYGCVTNYTVAIQPMENFFNLTHFTSNPGSALINDSFYAATYKFMIKNAFQ